MLELEEDLQNAVQNFCNIRSLKYEKYYIDSDNGEKKIIQIDSLYKKIMELIGKQNADLLNRYTDSLLSLYNTDAEYFYRHGFDDCCKIFFMLHSANGHLRKTKTAKLKNSGRKKTVD
ncbi:MAG TPA: hypothetical protein VHO66_10210 [Ruminiclostridium sp.]|nr:hypothetical protein [Ruminiclostridium sp.]